MMRTCHIPINALVVVLCGCFAPLAISGLKVAYGEDLIQRSGKYIDLVTDLQQPGEADILVQSFDAAVPQWIRFWELPQDAVDGWKVKALVIRDKSAFERAGLIPQEVPDFPFGYALGNQLFVLAQPSSYYTRHLMLHEGVHALAYEQFGGAGPTWFQEGTAELLATHVGQGATLKINQIPPDRASAPYWGRVKMIDQRRREGQIPTLSRVWRYQPELRDNVESYSFSWLAVMLLDMYPQYRPSLMQAARFGRRRGPGFNRRLEETLRRDLPIIHAQWRLLTDQVDYGFDRQRELVSLAIDDPSWRGQPIDVQVRADHGWQSIGVRVPGNVQLRIQARGQVTLADDPKPWVSEPQGITFQYARGRPVGQLLVCVLPNASDPNGETVKPLDVRPVGRDVTLETSEYCWVLLRINDFVDGLGNNRGHYDVRISRR